MQEEADTDSEWDSTLDFTSPRQTGQQPLPRIDLEIEDEDFSQRDSYAEPKPQPKERTSIAPNKTPAENGFVDRDDRSEYSERIVGTPRKATSKPESVQQSERRTPTNRLEEISPPPYDFRAAVTGTPEPQKKDTLRPPGKDRKGNLYDVEPSPKQQRRTSQEPSPAQPRRTTGDSFKSTGSWDSDTDADERTLRELKQTFDKAKQKERAAEEERQRLRREAEAAAALKLDDQPLTARSETTWKSNLTNFGNKLARLSGRNQGKKSQQQQQPQQSQQQQSPPPVTVTTPNRSEIIPVIADPSARLASSPKPTTPVPGPDPFSQSYAPSRPIDATQVRLQEYTDIPHNIDPPFFVKDEVANKYIYYFGHGNLQYYEVEEGNGEAIMPRMADKAEKVVERIWQELFGALRIITSFVILFIVELVKYLIKYVFQPLVLGLAVTIGDFMVKPFLSMTFNGIVQPIAIFLWNCFVALRHMFGPIGDILKKVLEQFALLFRAFRLVEINWRTNTGSEYQHVQTV